MMHNDDVPFANHVDEQKMPPEETRRAGLRLTLGLGSLHCADDVNASVDRSYEITPSGLRTRGYEIGKSGISQTPPLRKALIVSAESASLDNNDHGDGEGGIGVGTSKFVHFGGGIGKGASGSVSKAMRFDTCEIFALKAIGVHIQAKRHQLIKELNTYASVDCPFIVDFHGAFYDQGTTLLVLEYMNRGSMQQVIDANGPMHEKVLQRITAQVLRGLQHMHCRRQVHRDIKPSNIVLNSRGQAKLADFGIAKELGTLTNANTFVGTQIYMSPERIQSEPYGFPSDIWSFGLVLHTCASGKFPYTGADKGFIHVFQTITKDAVPQLPRSRFSVGMRNFLSKCLDKDPQKRWSAERLLLHPWVKDVPVHDEFRWPWESQSTDEVDLEDIRNSAEIMAEFVYASKPYTRSKTNMEQTQRLANCLNIPEKKVRQHFENLLPKHAKNLSTTAAASDA